MRIPVLVWIPIVLLSAPRPAPGIDYTNIDSLVVGDLVFFGATDKARYGRDDTVYAKHWVVNRSARVESLRVWGWSDASIDFREAGCSGPEDQAVCESGVPYWRRPLLCGAFGSSPWPIQPGVTLFEEFALVPEPVGSWEFWSGEAHFIGPWCAAEPPVRFLVRYIREGTTAAHAATWARIKLLYRE